MSFLKENGPKISWDHIRPVWVFIQTQHQILFYIAGVFWTIQIKTETFEAEFQLLWSDFWGPKIAILVGFFRLWQNISRPGLVLNCTKWNDRPIVSYFGHWLTLKHPKKSSKHTIIVYNNEGNFLPIRSYHECWEFNLGIDPESMAFKELAGQISNHLWAKLLSMNLFV